MAALTNLPTNLIQTSVQREKLRSRMQNGLTSGKTDLWCKTTTNAGVIMYINSDPSGATSSFPVPQSSNICCTYQCTALPVNASVATASYQGVLGMQNLDSTVSLPTVTTSAQVVISAAIGAFTLAFTVDGTNDAIIITASGIASEIVYWHMTIDWTLTSLDAYTRTL